MKIIIICSVYVVIIFGSIPVSIPVIPGYRCTEKGLRPATFYRYSTGNLYSVYSKKNSN